VFRSAAAAETENNVTGTDDTADKTSSDITDKDGAAEETMET